MSENAPGPPGLDLHRDHRRTFAENLYVYPVVSRRSRGVSLGINLNPDKICNFNCVYCQVDRSTPPLVRKVDEERLLLELEEMLELVVSGELFAHERFCSTPEPLRRLNDLAFSGDGEPTSYPRFLEVVRAVAEIKRRRGLDDVKLVLISNATLFHRLRVHEALAVLDTCNGEIWAKLEAGTEAYYKAIERSTSPYQRVLDNILQAARLRPLVIQALFLRQNGEPPSPEEMKAFCDRLNEILAGGGRVKLVQVYTVARTPPEPNVFPLSAVEVEELATLVQKRTGLVAEAFR
jgi:wyosine [tRNA(Phe)-imidazoG37] synthetase (radical SAM superfamily)